jgi:hypothetical protein
MKNSLRIVDEHISYQLPKLKSISNWVQGKKLINIKIKWDTRNSKVQPKKYKQKIDNNIYNNEILYRGWEEPETAKETWPVISITHWHKNYFCVSKQNIQHHLIN